MKKLLLLVVLLLALVCAGFWDGPLGHRQAGHGTWSLKHVAAALATPSAQAATKPVIYYDGGGRPACGWGVGTYQGPDGVVQYCIFDLADYHWKWVTL